MNASQTFQTVRGCVSVVTPAWMDVDEDTVSIHSVLASGE